MDMINCKKCGAELSESQKFCPSCGESATPRCPKCGNEVEKGLKFCPSCGCAVEEGTANVVSTSSPCVSVGEDLRKFLTVTLIGGVVSPMMSIASMVNGSGEDAAAMFLGQGLVSVIFFASLTSLYLNALALKGDERILSLKTYFLLCMETSFAGIFFSISTKMHSGDFVSIICSLLWIFAYYKLYSGNEKGIFKLAIGLTVVDCIAALI